MCPILLKKASKSGIILEGFLKSERDTNTNTIFKDNGTSSTKSMRLRINVNAKTSAAGFTDEHLLRFRDQKNLMMINKVYS